MRINRFNKRNQMFYIDTICGQPNKCTITRRQDRHCITVNKSLQDIVDNWDDIIDSNSSLGPNLLHQNELNWIWGTWGPMSSDFIESV